MVAAVVLVEGAAEIEVPECETPLLSLLLLLLPPMPEPTPLPAPERVLKT